MKREGINYPKFADRFAAMNFEAEPLPVLSLYPPPAPVSLRELTLEICGLDQHPRRTTWNDLAELPHVSFQSPLICQIFNWSETVEWGGIRLVDVLDHLTVDTHAEGYYALMSRDGMYFEALSRDEARDPRVLLATTLNGAPLPEEYGGPLRLVVPFLQGYKSVKWIGAIKAYRHNPVGIKRLLGQSRTGQLSAAWKKRFGIEPPAGQTGDLPPESSAAPAGQTRPDSTLASAEAGFVFAGTPAESLMSSPPDDSASCGELCEITAIVRPENRLPTYRVLEELGVLTYSVHPVLGRSRQRGLRYPCDGDRNGNRPTIRFLPKLLATIVVERPMVETVIQALIRANRSGPGHFGDGKIFVMDVADTTRINAAESGDVVIR
ncbi:MAG: molybdopterin-dependent oxidoreductase [Nitrospira sp.]|nr:molybdopterin-dependent oxidoreductase [Nitrospira sp.]